MPTDSATISCGALPAIAALEACGDDAALRIRADLASRGSVLALMKGYVDDLRGALDNDALPYRKLRRLFELGAVPERIEGHHYGVTLGLRTGDLRGEAAEHGNVLGFLWGETVGGVCPWVGKSFRALEPAEATRLSAGAIPPGTPAFAGINHFHRVDGAPLNAAANAVLELIWRQEQPPAGEAARYGHQRNGGHFLAHRAPSVHPSTPRTVFRLNYRFPALENSPPLPALVDEVVALAPGMYLGQLLFATERLFEPFDPAAPPSSYDYQHFGYFLIFDERWSAEASRLFPNLGIVEDGAAPGAPTLSFDDDVRRAVRAGTVDAVRTDLAGAPTVLHVLKAYADALRRAPRTDAPEFAKLEALFLAGAGPRTMDGFFRGASVTFQSQGLLAACGVNGLNLAWRVARHLSPWTGKRFDPIAPAQLAELTNGFELPAPGTTFGSNTVVFRTAGERITRAAMHAAGVWLVDATDDERRRDGYDARTFFFVGKPARSIVPGSEGKEVYQFNYRWKALRSPPPDDLCVDEIVAVADGLYLGKLLYATNVLRPFDPRVAPAEYAYGLFGYFLLMSPAWHALRIRIGLDLDDT